MAYSFRKFFLPKRKLFFPAGMLSLVLLPLLGFQILFSDQHFYPSHVLAITYPSSRNMEMMGGWYFTANERVISICGSESERKGSIELVHNAIMHLQQSGRNSEIQIELGDQSTWGDFIGVLNIFHKRRLKRYLVVDNFIRVFADTTYQPTLKSAVQPIGRDAANVGSRPIIEMHLWHCGTGWYPNPTISKIWDPPLPNSFVGLMKSPKHMIFFGVFCLLAIVNILSVRKSFFA